MKDFTAFYDRHAKTVCRQIRRWVSNREAVEEISQEVFLKVYRNRDAFDPRQSLSGWMSVITRNTTLDWLRKNANAFAVFDEAAAEALPCARPDAERVLIDRSQWTRLRGVFREFTSLQRRVFWMRTMRQMPLSDIAEQLGLSLASVKCALYRAKRLLAAEVRNLEDRLEGGLEGTGPRLA